MYVLYKKIVTANNFFFTYVSIHTKRADTHLRVSSQFLNFRNLNPYDELINDSKHHQSKCPKPKAYATAAVPAAPANLSRLRHEEMIRRKGKSVPMSNSIVCICNFMMFLL